MNPFGTGAHESPKDIRTFAYVPSNAPQKGGTRYAPEDIEHQHTVGICTAISLTQNAAKAQGKKYSAEFQYLLQKKFIDGNWDEGSSILSALKVAKNYGLLPAELWTYTTEADRKLPYNQYIDKLKNVDITSLMGKTEHVLQAYASVPIDLTNIKNAINESASGILCRFNIGEEWYTSVYGQPSWSPTDIEPLRPPKTAISGHAITGSNFDGGSVRNANTWGATWCEGGTAYYLFKDYQPTEAWIPYYQAPDHVIKQLQQRVSLLGQIADLLQTLINLKRKII